MAHEDHFYATWVQRDGTGCELHAAKPEFNAGAFADNGRTDAALQAALGASLGSQAESSQRCGHEFNCTSQRVSIRQLVCTAMRGLDVAVSILPARGDGCVPPTPGSNVKRRSDSDSYSVTTDPLATARTVVTLHRVARQSRVSPFSVRYRTD